SWDVRCFLEGSFAKTILRPVDALDRPNFQKVIELPLHGASREAKKVCQFLRGEQAAFHFPNQHRSHDHVSFYCRADARTSALVLPVGGVATPHYVHYHAVNDGALCAHFYDPRGRLFHFVASRKRPMLTHPTPFTLCWRAQVKRIMASTLAS